MPEDAMADVAIVGAGPAGLCLAVELAAMGLEVSVVDRIPCSVLAEPGEDGREIALTHTSRRQLAWAGIWQRIDMQSVAPIREARLYNGDAPQVMTLAGAERSASRSIGQLVPNRVIRRAAFEAALADSRITLVTGQGISALESAVGTRTLRLEDGSRINARLVVAADGRMSVTRRMAGLPAHLEDTGRKVLVCRMTHERPHDEMTWSWFGYERALALLPLNGQTSSVVMTLTPAEAERLEALDVAEFSAMVSGFYRHCLGDMQRVGEIYSYPLWVGYAQRLVEERLALIGDAAIGLHPATAHGFNVGLASVHRLVREISMARRRGQDIGSSSVLSAYERSHRRAIRPLWLASQAVVSLYGDTRPPARVLRQAALGLARQVGPLRWGLENYLLRDAR